MTPGEVGAMRDAALDLSQPLVNDLLADICRRVAKAGKITDTAEYEIYRAKALGMSKHEIQKAIARQEGLSDAMVDTLAAYIAKTDSDGTIDSSTKQVLDVYTKVTKSDMNQLMNEMRGVGPDGQIRDLQGTYRTCMDYAFQQVSTGTSDYTTALRKATRYLARRGIRAVVQSNDRAVSLEFATRRTLMNQLGSMDREIMDQNHDTLGCDGWEVSAHAACSPDHEPIQGRQYTDDDYKLLNETLQRPIGMFNCKHVAFPIILGVDSPQYTPAQLQAFKDDNAAGLTYEGRHYTMYEATQTQASLESEIRYCKNSILMDRELSDDQKLRTDQIRLGRLREEYSRFSRTAGLPTRSERTQVVDFGHSEAAKALRAYQKETSVDYASGDTSDGSAISVKMQYADIPQEFRDSFELGLSKSMPLVQPVLKKASISASYHTTDGLSYSRSKEKSITINPKASPEVLAHELFHLMDYGFSRTDGFDHLIREDYEKLLKPYNGDVFRYLSKVHPGLIHYSITGDAALEPKYSAISDIIHGITNGKVLLGAGHGQPGYWQKKDALAREAWAQFGRLCYNNDEGLQLLKQMFPTFYDAALNVLEEISHV